MSFTQKSVNLLNNSKDKFQESWKLKYGFIEQNGKALCVICLNSVVCRKSSVERHLATNHSHLLALKPQELTTLMKTKVERYESESTTFVKYIRQTNYLSAAGFELANLIAKSGKSFSEGEFVKSAWLNCAVTLFHDFSNRDSILNRIKDLAAGRNTIKDKIVRINADLEEQLVEDLKSATNYSICLDDSKDINSQSRLVIFIRFESNGQLREEPLKLMTMSGNTTGEDICSKVVQAFVETGVDLNKVVAVTTDGAPSMLGIHKGFVALFKKKISHPIIEFHCIIHQQALWSKSTFSKLEMVMRVVTKIVNYIAARPLKKRLFKLLLEEVESQYSGLLMYNDVRWLSRGKVLKRFVENLDEIRLFLSDEGQNFPELVNVQWLFDLMFFTDFTHHFNDLNLQLQGKGKTVDLMFASVKGFADKFPVFERDLQTTRLKYFPTMKEFTSTVSKFSISAEESVKIVQEFSKTVQDSSILYQERFGQFRKLERTFVFIRFPHKAVFTQLEVTNIEWIGIENLEMELIDFKASLTWTAKFEDLNRQLEQIEAGTSDADPQSLVWAAWDSLPPTFLCMKRMAKTLLTVFSSSYSCEQYFSSMNFILSKNRSRLGEESSSSCINLKVSTYSPRINLLTSEIQQQKSH